MAAPAPAPQYQTYKNQVPLKPGQSLGFTTGKGYYARPLAQAAASNPASAFQNLYGYTPMTPAQIQAQATNEISPIIQAITGQYNGEADQQAQQARGWANDVAAALGQINLAAPYQQAEGQQAAVDSALQQSLSGAGTSEAAGLAGKLAALQGSSGAPALQNAGADLTSQGVSSGNTSLASGSADIGNLIANEAAAANFGQKMPLIAQLEGAQQIGQARTNAQQSIGDATLQLESQLPNIIQDLTANNQTGLSNAVTAQQKQQALNFENWVKGQTVKQGAAKVKIAGENAQTAAQRAADTAAYQQLEASLKQEGITAANQRAANALKAKVAQGARPDPSLSKTYGHIVDANGNVILGADGKEIPVKTASGTTSGKTSSTAQRWDAKALGGARMAHAGFTDGKGVYHPPLSWQQFLTEGLSEGIPSDVLVKQGRRVYSQAEIKQGLIPKGQGG